MRWHNTEAWLLATGAFDKTVCLIDARSATHTNACTLPSDIESLTWDPFNPFHLYCAMEDGQLACIDVRQCSSGSGSSNNNSAAAIQFLFQAHAKTTSSISFSGRVPGMMATASIDKTVKIWDVSELQSCEGGVPKQIAYKTMNVGKLFALQYHPDDPFLLAAAGDTGTVAVWESDELSTIENHFKDRVKEASTTGNTYSQLLQQQQQQQQAEIDVKIELPVVTAAVVQEELIEDDSWMNDNSGIAGNNGATINNEEATKIKNKKNKSKKNKSTA